MCLQQLRLNAILQNKKTDLSIMYKYVRSTSLEVVASVVVLYEAILQHYLREWKSHKRLHKSYVIVMNYL
jgi:hypothetical protein